MGGSVREARVGRMLLACTALIIGCHDQTARSEACYPGDFERVSLADGGAELRKCTPDGGGYVDYDGPDPNALPDASGVDAAAICSVDNGQKLGFMCAGCATSDDCAPELVCVSFPNKGGDLCTRTCASATDCPSPSAACGNSGYCKP